MPANEPPPYATPAYNPPHYLLSSTGLSREDLIAQYEGFRQSLQHAESAPELVFERLIGNLREGFSEALIYERTQHAAIEEAWRREKMALQTDLDRATTAAKKVENVCVPSPVPSPVPPTATSKQTYLQFWFTSTPPFTPPSNNHNYSGTQQSPTEKSTRVRAATTTISAPYGIASGWPDMEHLASSANHGSYDTRMDPLINTPTIPTTLTHIVRFKQPFPTAPKVIVWLTGLSSSTGATVCVKAVANDITETEFALQISSGDGARVGSVGVAWAVWPDTSISDGGDQKLGVNVGSVSTVVPGSARVPVLAKSGSVRGKMVMAALSAVDLVLAGGVWVELVVVGGRWSMNAGPVDASVYSARVAYAFK